jgi:hypothetical protein
MGHGTLGRPRVALALTRQGQAHRSLRDGVLLAQGGAVKRMMIWKNGDLSALPVKDAVQFMFYYCNNFILIAFMPVS